MIDLLPALLASLLSLLASVGVGLSLQRHRLVMTEMLGMMTGMTIGMMTGIVVGYFVGAATDMFWSNLAGILAGVVLGVLFGQMGGLMGMMDGGMAGVMGGMMGAMLGVMLQYNVVYIWVTAIVLMALQLAALAGLSRLVTNTLALVLETDPVCRMKVDPRTPLRAVYASRTYYFCAPSCKHLFNKDPERYLNAPVGVTMTEPAR